MINPAHTPQPPARRDRLALVSLLLALVFPLGILVELLDGGVSVPLWSYVGPTLVLAGLPAALLGIVAGHVALRRANQHSAQPPRRGLARLGLVLGYGSLATLAGFVVWLMVHGLQMHIVF